MHIGFPQPPSCLPLSRKNVLLDKGTALRLTNICVCVHVSDWPCLGRPTQYHNSHDWVFSHCTSQQTAAAHAAASADRLTVILNWLDQDFMFLIIVLYFYIYTEQCWPVRRKITTAHFHNFIDQDPNNYPAKVTGRGDKLTNESQLLAAFGWWRVLIFYPVKTSSVIGKHGAPGLQQRNAFSKFILFDLAFLFWLDGRWYIFDEHVRSILSSEKWDIISYKSI